MDLLIENYPHSLATTSIYAGCTYATEWGNNRQLYYQAPTTPWAFFDGTEDTPGTFENLEEQYNRYEENYLTSFWTPTDVTIDNAALHITGRIYRVGAQICLEDDGTAKNLRIHMIQVLDHWPENPPWNRNGFKQAAEYEDISLTPGECRTILRDFTLDDDSWADPENVKFIAWAQQPQDSSPPTNRAEVFQAAKLIWPFPDDCNSNGVPDDQDITEGQSLDHDGNGIPDECDCVGDLIMDGQRDQMDLMQLLSHYGLNGGATYLDGDLDRDGDVDIGDLATLLGVYGESCP